MPRKYGGPNGYGYKPDPEGHQRTSFRVLKARLGLVGLAILASTDLSPFAPAVMDQGQTGSCTGHGTSGSVYTTCAKAGKPLPFVPSPKGIYDVARCIDRAPNANGSLPALTDSGAAPNEVARAITEWGIRPTQAPTADGRNSDCDPSTINDDPTWLDIEQDLKLKLTGEYTINSTGQALIQDVCLALQAGYAIGIAIFVDMVFEDWTPAQAPLGTPNFNDPDGGGHWIYLIGFRTDSKTGKKIFKFRNSWGTSWGNNGDGEGTEDFITSAYQLIVMEVTQEAA
jgi:hypothetical protein